MYRDRVRMTFTVDSLPDQAGIDPFALLIDGVPDDNMKKVMVSSATSAEQ